MSAVRQLASTVLAKHPTIDVLINNAGVLKLPPTARVTPDGLDARFAVNTIAPYLLTSLLMPALRAGKGKSKARVVNVSSAAQRSVSLKALSGASLPKDDMAAYAMSKLGITMWTKHMADEEGSRQGQHDGEKKIVFVAVNPGSLLNTKMVREGFGFTNGGADVGAKVLVRAATSDEFANANGEYFDNDARRFAPLHHDAADTTLNAALVNKMEQVLKRLGGAAS